MADELKPCPFICATDKLYTNSYDDVFGNPTAYVGCAACQTTGPRTKGDTHSSAIHAATESWNRRSPDALTEAVALLRRCLDELVTELLSAADIDALVADLRAFLAPLSSQAPADVCRSFQPYPNPHRCYVCGGTRTDHEDARPTQEAPAAYVRCGQCDGRGCPRCNGTGNENGLYPGAPAATQEAKPRGTDETFADPYKLCMECSGWITGATDTPGEPLTLIPCGHASDYENLCPSWGPVDGCKCPDGVHPYPVYAPRSAPVAAPPQESGTAEREDAGTLPSLPLPAEQTGRSESFECRRHGFGCGCRDHHMRDEIDRLRNALEAAHSDVDRLRENLESASLARRALRAVIEWDNDPTLEPCDKISNMVEDARRGLAASASALPGGQGGRSPKGMEQKSESVSAASPQEGKRETGEVP